MVFVPPLLLSISIPTSDYCSYTVICLHYNFHFSILNIVCRLLTMDSDYLTLTFPTLYIYTFSLLHRLSIVHLYIYKIIESIFNVCLTTM